MTSPALIALFGGLMMASAGHAQSVGQPASSNLPTVVVTASQPDWGANEGAGENLFLPLDTSTITSIMAERPRFPRATAVPC